jgi:hypothetical protein
LELADVQYQVLVPNLHMVKASTPLANAGRTILATGMAMAKTATTRKLRTRENTAVGAPRKIRMVVISTARIHSTTLAAMVRKTRAVITYLASTTHMENLREKANMDPDVLIMTLMAVRTTAGLNVKVPVFTGSQIATERENLTPAMSRVVKGSMLHQDMGERRRAPTDLPT